MRASMRSSFVVLSFASCVISTPLTTPPSELLVAHESTPVLPPNWEYISPAADHEELHLRVFLRQPHKNYMQIAQDVSNPTSSLYGQHLSALDLDSWLPNMDEAAKSVQTWLASNSAASVSRKGEWVQFTTTVAHASQMLNATFAKYSHNRQPPVLRTMAYSIPASLEDHIDFIFPTIHMLASTTGHSGQKRSLEARQRGGPATCDNSVCPQQIKSKYNITYVPPDASSGSMIGVAGFLEQFASPGDASAFLSKYGFRNNTTPYTFSLELINNGTNPTNSSVSGVEAMLDLDYTMPFTDPLPITYFSTGGRPPTLDDHGINEVPVSQSQNEPYLEFLEYMLAKEKPPQVISISYSDTEQTVPLKYAERVCDLLARLAARGVSVIGASGDGGAAGTDRGDCYGPDGKWHFMPTFPSSCPWITSVGATAAWGGGASFSSGGFSNYFGRPEWQGVLPDDYVDQLNGSHGGFYNKSGRAIPDVSLLGDDYLVITNGVESSHDGTSASTPVFAAMIALLNDIRLREGKPVLGHLNPLLYSDKVRATFDDVSSGFSSGCANSTTFEGGWDALVGWDPVTGLGTPNFESLRAVMTWK